MHRETQNLMKFQRSVDFLNRRFVFKDINIERFEVGQKAPFLGILKMTGKDVQISTNSTLPQRRGQLRWRK